MYLGSHNFSQSAWGKASRQQIQINNYEVGVVLPAAQLRPDMIPFRLNSARFQGTPRQPYFAD